MSKVVLITGASSGIGKAIGTHLTEKGFSVYGTSRNPKKYAEASPFKLVALEVSDVNSISDAINLVIQEAGQIDILINNAGVGITGPIEEIPEAEIKNAFEINYFGVINMMKAVLPHMRQQQSGLIINITSIAGYMGLPYRGIYSATKAALEITTEALRMETHSFGITITNVAPGDFATNIAAGRYHAPVIKGSAYEKPYGNTLAIMDAHVDSGNDPHQMAEAVYKVIKSAKPKGHYRVGAFMQKFSVVLKKILPDRVYERLLLNHYKL